MQSSSSGKAYVDPALSKRKSDPLISDHSNFYGPEIDIDEIFAKQSTPLRNFEIEHEAIQFNPDLI